MEGNIFEQLQQANNEPELSLSEYKEQRVNEVPEVQESTRVRETPKKEEKVEEDVEVEESEYKPWEEESKEKVEEDVEEDDDVIVTDSEKKVPLAKMLKIKAAKKEQALELERYKAQVAEYEAKLKSTLPKEEAEVLIDPIERAIKELKEPLEVILTLSMHITPPEKNIRKSLNY